MRRESVYVIADNMCGSAVAIAIGAALLRDIPTGELCAACLVVVAVAICVMALSKQGTSFDHSNKG